MDAKPPSYEEARNHQKVNVPTELSGPYDPRVPTADQQHSPYGQTTMMNAEWGQTPVIDQPYPQQVHPAPQVERVYIGVPNATIVTTYPQQIPYTNTGIPVRSIPLGDKSVICVCPSCNADISTKVEHKPTQKTHMFALLLCIFLCWPCVCIPYCTTSCLSAHHYCPNCNTYLGRNDS